MTDLDNLIRTERLALIDHLETLTPEQWATPSLCSAWTVQDVAAHLACAPVLPMHQAVVDLARARFNVNRLIADSATRWSARGPDAILAQLHENAVTNAKPTGVPRMAALVDALVHSLDIRRPLGQERVVPGATFGVAADFHTGLRWPMTVSIGGSVRQRIAGLRLVADDVGWTHGAGAEVHASGNSLLLMMCGRRVRPDEFTGPGTATLFARL